MTASAAVRCRWLAALAFLAVAAPAYACPVCFGDPDSPLVKGAVQGIVLLLVVTGVVLGGFVGLGTFWFVRARRAALPLGRFAPVPGARAAGAAPSDDGEPRSQPPQS